MEGSVVGWVGLGHLVNDGQPPLIMSVFVTDAGGSLGLSFLALGGVL